MKLSIIVALALVVATEAISVRRHRARQDPESAGDGAETSEKIVAENGVDARNVGEFDHTENYCRGSPFGCCPDGLGYASGPNFDGCPETHLATKFMTENCQNTLYGCCQDGARPATGPDFGGCGSKEPAPVQDAIGGYPEGLSAEEKSLKPFIPDYWPPDNIHEARANSMRASKVGGEEYGNNYNYHDDLVHLDPNLLSADKPDGTVTGNNPTIPDAIDSSSSGESSDEEPDSPEEPSSGGEEESESESAAASSGGASSSAASSGGASSGGASSGGASSGGASSGGASSSASASSSS